MLKKEQKTNLQVTKNFNMSEMEFYDVVPPQLVANATELLQNLQILRDACGKSIKIISGYRSPERNKEVGGATMSQHMFGNAADIQTFIVCIVGWHIDVNRCILVCSRCI